MGSSIKEQGPLNLKAIRNILTLRYDPEKATPERKLRLSDFNKVRHDESIPDRTESLLRNEIRRQAISAKSVAIPIGSGIDSAVIMSLTKDEFPDKNIFGISLGFSGSQDETAIARNICDELDVKCYAVHIDNVLRELPLQINIVGEPRWNLWYYHVLKQAKKLGAEIMLTGDGGDELFGGYVFRYSKFLDLVRDDAELPFSVPEKDVGWAKRAWSYLQCHERDWVPDQKEMFGSEISKVFDWYQMLLYFRPYFDSKERENELNQVFLADYNGKLIYDWMPTNASLGTHFGIKASSPMLSEALVEYATHIPLEEKYNQVTQEGKLVLRQILEKYGILDLVGKKKLGFGMDLDTLWNSYGKRIALEFLGEGEILRENLVERGWLERTLSSVEKTRNPRYINKLLQLLSLEIWYRLFVGKTMNPTTRLD